MFIMVNIWFDPDNDLDITAVDDAVFLYFFFDTAVGPSRIMLKIKAGAHTSRTFPECNSSLTYTRIPK